MASNIQITSESAASIPVASAPGKVRIFRDAADGALKYKNELGVVFDIASVQSYKEPVRAVSTAALPAYTRLGNIITADSNGALPAQDGVTLTVGDDFLLLNGALASENGIWRVLQVGSAGEPFIIERRGDASDSSQFVPGMVVPSGPEGIDLGSTLFLFESAAPIVLNATDLFFGAVTKDENFSILNVPLGETRTIPTNDQMLYAEDLTVDGDLVVNGLLFDVAPTPAADYITATTQTTDATPTTLHSYTTTVDNRTIAHKIQVQGLEDSTGDCVLFDIVAISYRNGASVVSSKDITIVNGPYKDAGASTWDATITVSGVLLNVVVTGEAAKTINWRVSGTVAENI